MERFRDNRHEIFRYVMCEMLKRVQTYEPDFFPKFCHVNQKKALIKHSNEWCWVQPAAYKILKQRGWLVCR